MEEELKLRLVMLEEVPGWTKTVEPLKERLVIPDEAGEMLPEDTRSPYFMRMNICAEEPYVLFV